MIKSDSSVYKICLDVGAGFSLLLNSIDDKQISDIYLFGMIRTMWKPDRIVSIGVEANYLNLMKDKKTSVNTEFGATDFEAVLYCYPINGILSMRILDLDVFAGAGIAFVKSSVKAFNEESNTSIIAGSYNFGLAYSYLISKNLYIGIEGKVFFISSINKTASALILKIDWDMLEW